jgi:hypothetical protein
MEKEDRENIRHISDTLDKILATILKPPSRIARVIELSASGIGILGILGAIDIIKNWIGG